MLVLSSFRDVIWYLHLTDQYNKLIHTVKRSQLQKIRQNLLQSNYPEVYISFQFQKNYRKSLQTSCKNIFINQKQISFLYDSSIKILKLVESSDFSSFLHKLNVITEYKLVDYKFRCSWRHKKAFEWALSLEQISRS